MSKEQPLLHKLYWDKLYFKLARLMSYTGFPGTSAERVANSQR